MLFVCFLAPQAEQPPVILQELQSWPHSAMKTGILFSATATEGCHWERGVGLRQESDSRDAEEAQSFPLVILSPCKPAVLHTGHFKYFEIIITLLILFCA